MFSQRIMDTLIKEDSEFLSNLVKIFTQDKIKWTSNIFNIFAYGLNSQNSFRTSSLMKSNEFKSNCQINFLHECCTSRNLKIILIDLEDNLNCTIIGQLEPLTENCFQQAPLMILLRRMTKYSAGPGTWSWKIHEYHQVPSRKLIQLNNEKRFLYFFNKLQYVRMITLVSYGMLDFSDVDCENWRFDECNFKSDKIKETYHNHFIGPKFSEILH